MGMSLPLNAIGEPGERLAKFALLEVPRELDGNVDDNTDDPCEVIDTEAEDKRDEAEDREDKNIEDRDDPGDITHSKHGKPESGRQRSDSPAQ